MITQQEGLKFCQAAIFLRRISKVVFFLKTIQLIFEMGYWLIRHRTGIFSMLDLLTLQWTFLITRCISLVSPGVFTFLLSQNLFVSPMMGSFRQLLKQTFTLLQSQTLSLRRLSVWSFQSMILERLAFSRSKWKTSRLKMSLIMPWTLFQYFYLVLMRTMITKFQILDLQILLALLLCSHCSNTWTWKM
mgnify:CR=1 FL=1